MHAVAELRHAPFFVCVNSAIRLSSSLVLGPVVIHPDLNTSPTASTSLSVISGGENGIFILFVIINLIPLFYTYL